ncbi:MAG: hypothetical protein H0U77_04145 [Nocardioidaceae bacterium]|nr:hypothetical protein [Nocardioidaceae bacterium]
MPGRHVHRLDNDGDAVTATTVSEANTPDQLTGEVLGVIDDGIAPGVDMVMVRRAGSAVTGSGRPGRRRHLGGHVRFLRLRRRGTALGAVAYGLSFAPSDVAGVTPAAQMYDVLDGSGRAGLPVRSTSRSVTTERCVRLG